MIRQLPAAFALVIRSNCAPVIARLPQSLEEPRLPPRPPLRPRPRATQAARTRPSSTPNRTSPTTCPPSGSPTTAPPTPGADHDHHDPITAVLDSSPPTPSSSPARHPRDQPLHRPHRAAHRTHRPDHRHRPHPRRTTPPSWPGSRPWTGRSPTWPPSSPPTPPAATALTRPRHGGNSPPPNARSPSPACGPGSSRSTGPATATWPPPSPPAGPPTTCACTAWTSCPACGPSCTSSPPHRQAAVRPGRIPGPHPARPRRPADDRDLQLRPLPPPRPGPRPALERVMTDATLRQALAYARRGWPVFPCLPGQKIPATRHGFRDATTDQQQISDWFGRGAGWNLAIATGAPGPDVLDVDRTAPPETATPPSPGSAAPGWSTVPPPTYGPPPAECTPTSPAQTSTTAACPATTWTSGRRRIHRRPALPGRRQALPAHQQARRPRRPGLGRSHPAARTPAQPHRPQPRPAPGLDLTHLTRWVASQPEGNRNAGLFWAANRALDADRAADLSPLAVAARQAGLGDKEITRTLDSARRTGQHRAHPVIARPRRVS